MEDIFFLFLLRREGQTRINTRYLKSLQNSVDKER